MLIVLYAYSSEMTFNGSFILLVVLPVSKLFSASDLIPTGQPCKIAHCQLSKYIYSVCLLKKFF